MDRNRESAPATVLTAHLIPVQPQVAAKPAEAVAVAAEVQPAAPEALPAKAKPDPAAAAPTPVQAPPAASSPTATPAPPSLPPAPEYRMAGQLNPPPRPLTDIDPVYPDQAQGREGSVVLRLLIGANGDVESLAVVRATPAGIFEASALTAFGAAKFSPGYINGVAVKSQLTIEVAYTPTNRGGGVSGQGR